MKLRYKMRGFMCDTMDWHSPAKHIGFDGCSFTSTCRHCNRRILQDSQGNWFAIDRRIQ